MAIPSLGTVVQYAVIALLGYILAGAPFLSHLSGGSSSTSTTNPRSSSSSPGNRQFSLDKVESLVIPDPDLRCEDHDYRVHVLAREPLVIYIEGFVSEEEAGHVVEMSEPNFVPSTVWTEGKETLNASVRKSEKARLDRDHVVRCIEERARRFQGWRPHVFVEKLWAQRYRASGHYAYHYDWSTATASSGRVSSFMVYLEANCTGGGTNFPRLKMPGDESWCRFLECEGEGGEEGERREGVTFKAIKGNAVYWENLRSDGSGYKESWHAGLPVKEGVKIGLNIWSWYQEGLDARMLREESMREGAGQ
ncbi:hypothetical protein BU24DRAFT_493236 [Aaosphaeria arxii CBS 175.79]|uniref:Prolyl 4-hydroxylase alpha subunit domain-containing protein n=1 Tax=Aaosphaeria arxii CBS 175.79 TaxID=1450172 RepID=A0A6A5XQW6_9PLEO|nr:uncharacterized protein BU24DRAFT_493236 [Aaosphaeria arxii CBS 175.79]KAF2014694.1 hypothetical protein BU24DRAFT_493236 [Aaosphaeria arxii CBS 175.79]